MEKKQNNLIDVLRISLILLIICSLTAAAVSFVYAITYQKADENLMGIKREAMETIFGDKISVSQLTDIGEDAEGYRIERDGQTLGYSVNITVGGFGGDMEVMVGYDSKASVCGVQLISHSETPGLGERVGDADYLSAYIGQSGTLILGQDIDAISGSTISSKAMLEAVNRATAIAEVIVKGEN